MIKENPQEKTVLCVQTGDSCYGFELSAVTRVMRSPAISPLPWLPEHYEGVCILSGAVLPVAALDSLQGKREAERPEKQAILVVHSSEYECGILVGESPFLIRAAECDKLKCTAASVTEGGLVLKEQYRMPSERIVEIVNVEETLKNLVVCE